MQRTSSQQKQQASDQFDASLTKLHNSPQHGADILSVRLCGTMEDFHTSLSTETKRDINRWCGWYVLRPGKFGCLECNITMITVMQLKTSSLKHIQFSFMARVASTKAIENSYIMILQYVPALRKFKFWIFQIWDWTFKIWKIKNHDVFLWDDGMGFLDSWDIFYFIPEI